MIYSVRGTLIYTETNLAVIECSGVGYACRTTFSTLSALDKIGSEVRLYTVLNVRQDDVELFGFATMAELDSFKLLTTVSGVGPKAALSILSDLSPEGLAMSIATSDTKTLTRSPGIGAKIAQRIVLELKDKFKGIEISSSANGGNISRISSGGNMAEAILALTVLGFTGTQAAQALADQSADTSIEDLVKIGLKKLASF